MRIVLVMVLMIATAASTDAQDVNFNGQHFRMWKVAPSDTVELKGQFDGNQWWQATVGAIEYLANPAVKTHQGTPSTTNEQRHLTGYALTPLQSQPRRKVRIWNQFKPEGEDWQIDQPIWLLVPAAKSHTTTPQAPGQGDHYACYSVVEPNWFVVGNVRLRDQFDDSPDKIRRIKPSALCVPVRKRHRNQETPLMDERTHFAIYTVDPPRALTTQVFIADQFSTQALEATDREMLVVPTRKQWPVPN
jgi:hypothetical protein